MNLDELHDELVRMGRRPVPAPRPELVRSLLDRIELDEDLPTPVPIQMARRDPWVRFRMVAVGAIAAALLSAVGLVSVFKDGGTEDITISAAPVSSLNQPNVPQDPSLAKEITVGNDASVTTEDGRYQALCPGEGTKIPTTKGVYVCHAGDTVLLVIVGGRIVDAGVEGVVTSEPPASTTTGAPGATVAPPPAQTPPARVPSASVVTTTTAPGTAPTTTAATPPPVDGGGSSPAPVTPSFTLNFTTPDEGAVTLTWDAYTGPNFARYVVLRTSSMSDRPDTPTYTPDSTTNKVADRTPASNTSYTERFVDVLPVGTSKVSYRVAVLEAGGNVLALSSTTTLELEWSMGPSEVLPPESTTVPPSPTTTSAPSPDGSPVTTAVTTATTTN